MEPRRRRVLVALHRGEGVDVALGYAASLALELDGELVGLFLEDQTLFDLCGLDAVEVDRSTGAAKRLDPANLERQLRATAGAARASVSRVAAATHVAWSFEVRRGRVGEAVLEATERAGLVVASRGSFGTLTFAPGAERAGPVVALLEGGPGEIATLDAAARAARRGAAPVVGLLVGARSGEERAALDEAAARVGVSPVFRAVGNDPDRIVQALSETAPRLFVVDARTAASERALLARYLAAAGSEAILVGAV